MSAEIKISSQQPLKKESIFLLSILLEILMRENDFKDQSYTEEDINDTLESLSPYKFEWFSNLCVRVKTNKRSWIRQNIFRLTLTRDPEPHLIISIANFCRIQYYENFLKALVKLTDCKLQKIGSQQFVIEI